MSEKQDVRVVDALVDLGEAWASHGLKLAESALATTALTLSSVSKVLGALAGELGREQEPDDVIDAHGAPRS